MNISALYWHKCSVPSDIARSPPLGLQASNEIIFICIAKFNRHIKISGYLCSSFSASTRREYSWKTSAIRNLNHLEMYILLKITFIVRCGAVGCGAVGESIGLPTDEEGPIRGPGFMQWKKNNTNVILLVSEQDSSPFETRETNTAFKGRLIVNYETGALTISSLREEDSGEYVFNGLRSSVSLRPKTIQLHIYERIVSVQVTSQVNNSTDDTSCNVILSCSVIGGSQVVLSWSRNGENLAGAENRATLTVSPTHAEEDYTCTAINPISSLSNTTKPCQTGAPVTPSPGLSLCALKSVLFSLGLVAMVSAVIAVNARERCCRDQWGLRKEDESVRVMEKIPP